MARTRVNHPLQSVFLSKFNLIFPSPFDNRLQWESSIIILPAMPYVFLYEDIFVGVIGALIVSLFVLRYLLRRKRD
jgi:hypothetical protein